MWLKQPGMLGFRFSFNDPGGFAVLNEGRLDWLWAEAEKAGIPIMLMLWPSELQFADRIAERRVYDAFGPRRMY